MKKILKVFISSPYKDNIKLNTNLAKGYAKFAVSKGVLPIVPHVYFPMLLDLNEEDIAQRKQGIDLGLVLMEACDELWVFGDAMTEGMLDELNLWVKLKGKTKVFFYDKAANQSDKKIYDFDEEGIL